jgi:hypothetical protein
LRDYDYEHEESATLSFCAERSAVAESMLYRYSVSCATTRRMTSKSTINENDYDYDYDYENAGRNIGVQHVEPLQF